MASDTLASILYVEEKAKQIVPSGLLVSLIQYLKTMNPCLLTDNQLIIKREQKGRLNRFIFRISLVALIIVSFFFNGQVSAQTTPVSFTKIPMSDPEIHGAGRGAIFWNGIAWNNSQAPQVPNGVSSGRNGYIRFNWYEMESAQGVYTLTGPYPSLEFWLRYIMDRGETVGLGVMSVCGGCDAPLDGGSAAYPAYLHTMMQAEAATSRDWKSSDGYWIPNWNSNNYLSRFEALLDTIAKFINTKSYNGRPYRDVVDYIDIRGYGNFGEWHNAPYWNQTPTGRVATSASLKRIIDAHINKFPNYPLINLCGAFDAGNASEVPVDVTQYALTASNNWGRFGWRRDNLGEYGTDAILANNPYSYNGYRFDTAILNRWKYAQVTGEPILGGGQYATGGPAYFDLRREINLYHIAHFGNGNYPGGDGATPSIQDTLRNAFKLTGYRYNLNGGTITNPMTPGLPFTVTLNWQNLGVAPFYGKNFRVNYELRNASNVAVWTGTSYFRPFLFLPGDSTVTDQFNLPNTVPTGTYTLRLIIRDSTGYRQPLPIAITGRAADGSYLIGTVTVGAPSANQPPVARAGADQVITAPVSLVNLSGATSSDPDGTITTYSWTKISGPAGSVIQTPATAATQVTGLTVGSFFFRLTVTDNLGATASDTVIVTVNPAANQAPNANAGADIAITLPTNSTTLNGTASNDPDGTISTYSWTRISGPATFTLGSPAAASSALTNLVQGTYSFRLLVTDNSGAQDADTVIVTVNPAANQAPNANAGADIAITLPTNSTTLNGTASNDPDGTISTYSWTRISGPATFTLGSPAAASSALTNLVQGTYSFRLLVTDNSGAQDADTVIVTVNPAANQAPIANAGTDITVAQSGQQVNLNGTASNDPDGTIVSYNWVKISGPGTITIANSNTATPGVIGLVQGVYVFELTVTDNSGAQATDRVTVTVGAPANQAPVAVAGNDTTIVSPASTAVLNGTGSFDPDGTIVSWQWRQLTGPAAALIQAPGQTATNISSLQEGEYSFELTVTDNAGLTDKDTVAVIVMNTQRSVDVFKLYPNPTTTGSFNLLLNADSTGTCILNIYTVNGVLVKSESFTKGQYHYDGNHAVLELKSATYFVEVIINGKKRMVTKLVKQ